MHQCTPPRIDHIKATMISSFTTSTDETVDESRRAEYYHLGLSVRVLLRGGGPPYPSLSVGRNKTI
jgi:hypothetical protein